MRLIKPNGSKVILHINEASLKKWYGLFFLYPVLCYFAVIALIYHLHWVEDSTRRNPIEMVWGVLYTLCISGSRILFSVHQIVCACMHAHTEAFKVQSSGRLPFLSVNNIELAN